MVSISNNGIIVMNAGDSFEFPLFIDRGVLGQPVRYKIKRKDTIYFVVCEPNQSFTDALIRKVFTKKDTNRHGDVNIILDSSDTEYILSGRYYYEIKIKLGNGKIETIVPKRKFIIME